MKDPAHENRAIVVADPEQDPQIPYSKSQIRRVDDPLHVHIGFLIIAKSSKLERNEILLLDIKPVLARMLGLVYPY